MKIALVGNINDQCGIATYGEDLLKYATDDVEYWIISPQYSLENAIKVANNCDAIHLNYYYGIQFNFSLSDFCSSIQKPILLTNHATNRPEEWFSLVKTVVVHEKPIADYHTKIIVVPHGIPEKNFPYQKPSGFTIAQAGFPFFWKNFWKTCEIANHVYEFGYKINVKLFMPDTHRWNVFPEINKCRNVINSDIPLSIEANWLEEDQLIYSLHKEASVISCYTEGSYYGNGHEGPSGSVRMAIAAKRPVVINGNAPQYHDIIGYNGIYPVYKDEDLAQTVIQAHKNGGYAHQLIFDQSYVKICQIYRDLYKEIL